MFSSKKFICFLFILFSFLSCDKLRPQSNISLSEANKKFLEICQKQYNFNVTIFPLKNTLWVYLPIKSPFLTMTANEGGPIKSQEYQEKYKINFIDAVFEERQFKIFYDIPLDKIYNQDYGYNSTYAEEYQTTQRNILTAITQTYSEVEKRQDGRYYKKVIGDIDLADKNKNETHKNLVHSYVKTETVPDFFIIIIADVIRGIETKTTIAFNDLLRATIDHSFQEEYAKRTISEYPIGNKKIINDLEGKHLEIKEISWADFLAQQIVYRSRFKYQTSSFMPIDFPEFELTKIAAAVIRNYDFEDYESVELHNLATNLKTIISKEEIDALPKDELNENRSLNSDLFRTSSIKPRIVRQMNLLKDIEKTVFPQSKAKLHTLIFDDQGQISAETVRELE